MRRPVTFANHPFCFGGRDGIHAFQRNVFHTPANFVVPGCLDGHAPIGGTRYELQRLRCHVCGEVETAQLLESAGEEKFDPSVASTLALLHYVNGMPFNRLEKIQQAAGVPLPASTQWEVLRDAIRKGPMAVYEQLLDEAARRTTASRPCTLARPLQKKV